MFPISIMKQISIIFAITAFSEIIVSLLNLQVPANVIGMIILFTMLCLKLIKESDVKEVGDFFPKILISLYIPGAVSIIEDYHHIKQYLIPFFLVCLFCTIIVMVSTGITAKLLENTKKEI